MALTDPITQANNILRVHNSKDSNYYPIFVPELLSSRRQTPEVWKFCVVQQCLSFCSSSPETPEPLGTENLIFCPFFVFCCQKLMRACLKARALTGYVGPPNSRCQEAFAQATGSIESAAGPRQVTSHTGRMGAHQWGRVSHQVHDNKDQIWTPPPNPKVLLLRIPVGNQVSERKFLLRRAWSRPTAFSRTFTPLLRETRFP